MKFYGREEQRKLLHKLLAKDDLQTALIYGRRRVGKSELIKQVLRESEQRSIYYECKQTTEENNTDSLAEIIADSFHYPKPAFDGIEKLLEFLFEESKQEPFVLVLDEYPYLRHSLPGIDSILQSLIDKYRDVSHLKFILCGSYVDVMKSLLESENPLYGRIDRVIELKPMDYYESSFFYDTFSNEDKVRLYSVFGGIPYYNRLIHADLTVKENIIELIASPGARLENEVSMYLKSEISRITNANEVIEALAKGFSRYSDILSQSHVSSGPTLIDVLDKLIRMDVVRKEAPINDENNRRKVGYYISDPLSLFYYRYVFRYASQMSVMEPEVFFERYIREDYDNWYVPHAFEELCKQYLIRKNRVGKMEEPFFKIGRYWYDDPKNKTNGEFDLVTQDANGYIFYEAKFRSEPLGHRMVEKEIKQVQQTGMNCYRYGFLSRSGFSIEPRKDLILIGLEEIYDDFAVEEIHKCDTASSSSTVSIS
ncbi:MAG: ATP-binding protein [Lachnospiraceae bacterium]|nr:ATP-binding protein [Lachnospiraceae bacterium]